MHRTKDAPFPDAERTGRCFITPCCTSAIYEFIVDGEFCLSNSVVGHGWSQPWPGRVEDINDTGHLIEADGTERAVYWRADRERAWP